ncbi:hypothetical protein V2A60_008143 [Cordyceps javanica]
MALGDDEEQNCGSECSNAGDFAAEEPAEHWTDKFTPFPETRFPEPDTTLMTLPAILVGITCGIMVNGSNIYLGLKTGWTSSANLLGSVMGFAVLKNWSPDTFSPHQNNIVQTVATASAGLSSSFISAIPATYQLGLLSTPSKDLVHILLLTAAGGYFGLLSVVPLRRFFIENKSARDLNLVFPSSTVTALTIRGMHSAASSASAAVRQMRVTLWAFAAAAGLRILSPLATGILWEWHIFTWARGAHLFSAFAVAAESWGWFVEWTPAMIGSGMLVDMNVAASFFAGSVLAWAVIGPYIVSQRMAFGLQVSADPYWAQLQSYTSMSTDYTNADTPSPRYWLLWPGVAYILCQWFSMFYSGNLSMPSVKAIWQNNYTALSTGDDEKPPPNRHSIPKLFWAPGVLFAGAFAIISMKFAFGISTLKTLLALGLAFPLSLVAIQATGATDTTPLTAVSTVSQIVLSLGHASSGYDMALQQRLNLLGGALANMSAGQACDLMGDFRVGYLLRTPASSQFLGQVIGTLFAALVAPMLFNLFSTAYPCIIHHDDTSSGRSVSNNATYDRRCEFGGPSIATWRAVAVAASAGAETAIPSSSMMFAVFFTVLGATIALLRNLVKSSMKPYFPNMMIMGLAFTMPSPPYGLAMLIGALVARIWRRRHKSSSENYLSSVAAGLIAGEGIGGIVNGALTIAVGWGGNGWGTSFGCPDGRC